MPYNFNMSPGMSIKAHFISAHFKGVTQGLLLGCLLLFGVNMAQAQKLDHVPISQSLTGSGGLIWAPTAYLQPDRSLSVGISYNPKNYPFLDYSRQAGVGEGLLFVNLSYLPFLELTGRLTMPENAENNFGIGDRSFLVRVQLLKEKKVLPAIAVGVSDPVGTSFHHSNYLVSSKSIALGARSILSFHAGFGGDLIPSKPSRIRGLFGGMGLKCWEKVQLQVEYDSQKINAGLALFPFPWMQVSLNTLGMKTITGGVVLTSKL